MGTGDSGVGRYGGSGRRGLQRRGLCAAGGLTGNTKSQIPNPNPKSPGSPRPRTLGFVIWVLGLTIAKMHNPFVPETLEGWSVLHLMYRVRWDRLRTTPETDRHRLAEEAINALAVP